ncbi:MAG: acetylornithine transaminase [Armatimonadetes bacterium]|nr:acetylornithine transaminase [Armatimonadota bacterium]
MDTRSVIRMSDDYLMNTIARQPVVFVRGQGMRVWDADGMEYLDFLAGIAVCGLGHSHPALVDAICKQAAALMHVSNLYHVPQGPALAKKLVELSGMGRAFLCNSGAEANEAAIKLARKWSKENRGPEKFEIITTEGSFHGRTLTTVTATGQPKYHQGFEPLVPGFRYVPYNDVAALESAIGENTCAVMLEPIQGESGVHPASQEYMQAIRRICDARGLLLILDEIQTGLGRTGKWFGFEHYGIKPDIISLAKTLGGGFPIGACLATGEVATGFRPGNHSSTFGGNPLACAAGLAAVQAIEDEGLVENSAEVGAYFRDALMRLRDKRDDIGEIRGIGLMLAMEMNRGDAPEIAAQCLRDGLIVNAIGRSIIRFLPPLIATKSDVDSALRTMSGVLDK